MTRRTTVFVGALVAMAAACGQDEPATVYRQAEPATTTTTTTTTTTSTTVPPPTTSTTQPLPRHRPGPPRVLITPTGVIVPTTGRAAGAWRVTTPCGRPARVRTGTPIGGTTVVLDPGHGGVETGAVGDNRLRESDLNLAVARLVKAALEAQGATVMLTRTADYRVTLAVRATIAKSLRPRLMVSVHHNGGVDGPSAKPGTETYYQRRSVASKRLAGLLYEEELALFRSYPDIEWWGNVDAGAKYRMNSRGGDYYGILRRTAGVPTVLSEALFLSASRAEADLLARPDVQRAEADAIVRAVRRFLLTRDPGSGYLTPIPRTSPGGPGGGAANCVDPRLE